MKLLSPQKVVSDQGFTVQVADRYSIEYLEKSSHWTIEVDIGIESTGVYKSTLTMKKGITTTTADEVFERMIKALNLMGVKPEITD